MLIGKWLAGALGALAVSMGSAVADATSTVNTVSVPGTAAISLAGRTDVTIAPPGTPPSGYLLTRNSPPGPYSESFPTMVPAGSGATFQFSVTGTINTDINIGGSTFAPDGISSPININAVAGNSGYDGPIGSLVGIFLNDNDPQTSSPPATLNFAGHTNFTTLSPSLNQMFFIGDGLTGTGTGTTQTFTAPAGATRLFLGIPDANFDLGTPGTYDDNGGSFSVTVTATGVPEPTCLSLLGLAAVGLLKRNRPSL